MNPLVSILIPCYNQAAYLPKAIESALAQNYSPLEIIVSDDASTDETPDIVEKYLHDRRIRYERAPSNLGRVRNYRRGLHELARGEWMINLDGDDHYTNPDYIAHAMELALKNPEVTFIFGRQRYGFPHRSEPLERPGPALPRISPGKSVLRNYFRLPEGVPHLSALYRRDLALKAGLFENDILFADAEAIVRLLPLGQVGYLDEFAGTWISHGSNESSIPRLESRIDNLRWITEPARFFLDRGLLTPEEANNWQREGLRRAIAEALYFYLDRGAVKMAFTFYLKTRALLPLGDRLRLLVNPRLLLRMGPLKIETFKKILGRPA